MDDFNNVFNLILLYILGLIININNFLYFLFFVGIDLKSIFSYIK